MKRILTFILACTLAASCMACGESGTATDTTTAADTTEAVTTAAGYDYTGLDYGGTSFRILSTVDGYSMHMQFDRDEANGEVLNDAIYDRNRLVEDKLNIKIEENALDLGSVYSNNTQMAAMLRQSVEAGDDICDLALIPPKPVSALILEGYFYDLTQYDEFQLDEAWYNQSYNDAVTIDGKMYFGMSDATVGLTDGMWAMFFNEDMLADHKLEKPYDLVRSGDWTLDKMTEYSKAVASLNGDEAFTWNQNGKSVYGVGMSKYNYYRFLNAADEKMVVNDDDGLAFTAGSERFFNVVDKLLGIADVSLGIIFPGVDNDYDAVNGGYMYPFSVERALFQCAEICKAQNFRDYTFNYGLVPYPKYDAAQENYVAPIYQEALAFSIPITCETPERSAQIWDALAYEGMESVVPVYREVTVEQKGLRNDDSIEMLGIVTAGAYADVGQIFSISTSMISSIYNEINDSTGKMASIIEQNRQVVEAKIEELEGSIAKIK